MLVNGKVWPFLEVEPRLYRFRVLNGCNARILNLDLPGTRMWQIGAEGGMWDAPVPVTQLVLAPAERADVLVDFSQLAGAMLPVKNLRPPSTSVSQTLMGESHSSFVGDVNLVTTRATSRSGSRRLHSQIWVSSRSLTCEARPSRPRRLPERQCRH